MLFDTDVVVWLLRGNRRAAQVVDASPVRVISVVTYMETLQGARDRREMEHLKTFFPNLGFRMLPLTENIGHRAAVLMQDHALAVRLCVSDALIAATALENGLDLATANRKHYAPIPGLALHVFRP